MLLRGGPLVFDCLFEPIVVVDSPLCAGLEAYDVATRRSLVEAVFYVSRRRGMVSAVALDEGEGVLQLMGCLARGRA